MSEHKSSSPALDFFQRLESGHFRFAVRGPEGHSTPWTAFARRNDYYIGARPVMGSVKISLHESGVCRVALTEQHYRGLAAEGLAQPRDRAMAKWKRRETPERGAVHVLSVIFPSDHLLLAEPNGTYRKPLIIFGEAPFGKAVEFGVFFSREEMTALEDRFLRVGKPILGTKLDDGTVVSVVVREIDFDRSVLPSQEKLDSAACTVLSQELNQIEHEQNDFTAMLWTAPKDGETLFLYEISGVGLRRRPN